MFGYFQERAEHRQLAEDVMSGKLPIKFGHLEGNKEAFIERRREGLLFYGKVPGATVLWLVTSGLAWIIWKVPAAIFRQL